MLYFISKIPTESGSYGMVFSQNLTSDGVQLPAQYYDDYVKYKGFVNLIFNDIGEIVRVEPNEKALNEYLSYAEPLDKMFEYEQELESLNNELNADQDAISQCMEAFMLGNEMPYDYQALITKRNEIRSRIKELQLLLEEKSSLEEAFENWNQKKIAENAPPTREVIYSPKR